MYSLKNMVSLLIICFSFQNAVAMIEMATDHESKWYSVRDTDVLNIGEGEDVVFAALGLVTLAGVGSILKPDWNNSNLVLNLNWKNGAREVIEQAKASVDLKKMYQTFVAGIDFAQSVVVGSQ